jgi:dynein heavy chain
VGGQEKRLFSTRSAPMLELFDGPVGRFDAANGDNIDADLSRLEALSDSNFLKVDESTLPIGDFDTVEAEEQDLAPEKWLEPKENGKPATANVPYFRDGWKWRPCDVLSYDENTKQYTVQLGSKTKGVSRLNICFDKENRAVWEDRRTAAIRARDDAKQRLRYDYYIAQRDGKAVSSIQKSTLRSIHAMVNDGLPERVPFPVEGTASGALLRSLTKSVVQDYGRTMKRAIAAFEYVQNPKVAAEYNALRLAPLPAPPQIPELGKVDIPQSLSPYNSLRANIAQTHFSSSAEVMRSLVFLADAWESHVSATIFMDTTLEKLELPCSLEDFNAAQIARCTELTETLKIKWKRAAGEKLMDEVQDVYDFFQSDMDVFNAGPLKRLLKHVELRMTCQLREHVIKSLNSWLDFIRSYTSGLANVKDGMPLLGIELAMDGTRVVTSPEIRDIEGCISNAVIAMIEGASGMERVDKDLMSLLHLPSKILLNLDNDDELVADVDGMLLHGLDAIKDAVAEAMQPVLQLTAKYEKYSYIMKIDAMTMVADFEDSEPPPTEAMYLARIRQYHSIIAEVETAVSYDVEYFDLVRVDATVLKETLTNKAAELRDALCDQLTFTARERLAEIGDMYEKMLERVSQKPADEAELRDLKIYLEKSNDIILNTVEEVAGIHTKLDSLSEFGVLIQKEDSDLAWSTMKYPQSIEDAFIQTQIAIEADQTRMLDELNKEKEDFEKLLEKFESDVKNVQALEDYANQEKVVEEVNGLVDALSEAVKQGENFNMREAVFQMPPTEYPILAQYQKDCEPFAKLWNMISDFHTSSQDWLVGEFIKLDGTAISNSVDDWWKTSFKMSKTMESDYPGAAKCALKLREDTTEFRQHLPIIQSLATPALKDRHWEALSEQLGGDIVPDDELTLQSLLDLNASDHIDQIQEICVKAEKEYSLERSLKSMQEEWGELEFDVKPYKESGTFIVGGIDDIITLLDDHVVKTQTMRQSLFIAPIEAEARLWEKQLHYAQHLIDDWIACQKAWMYLEPIFSSDDIMRQLPTEARRFQDVDKMWRKVLHDTNDNPVFISQAHPDKQLMEKFKFANEKLDKISKGLNDYLEVKRLYFPRFFFLSPDQLIEILSQTKDPKAVQPHLNKAFEGVSKVKFEDDLKITVMISQETEEVKMIRCVDPESPTNKGNVEKWLLELESIQWDSIRDEVEKSKSEFPTIPRTDWMVRWPAQVILLVSQIFWTRDVSTMIKERGTQGIKEYADMWNGEINKTVKSVQEMGKAHISKQERKLRMKTLGALTVIDVHARETKGKMIKVGVHDITDFEWVSQLRYYWEPAWQNGQACKKDEDTAVARIVNAKALYGYEYLGNSMRLVITPLTDRCYRTMISAIDLLYGGAPEGPAGTGKTETVKDLSKAIAIQCVVFNCSDGLDYLAMAKFFKGLAGCGSWCCFDEFNRINVEVLSVIAQQILTITKAKKENLEKFHFEGTYMKLNQNCNVFITMNPGYAGRAELPDNLKALFRPCAMMVPDYALIGEIRLYSFGFVDAKSNAKKLVCVLQLSSEQLSNQKHYDYGMRAVNSILVAAGELRQVLGDDPEWNESKIVLRAVMDVNLPKFTVEDLPLFRGITSDLFPGIKLPESDHGTLNTTIAENCHKGVKVAPDQIYKLDPVPAFTTKIVELFEMVCVRWGVMVVGETGSGKSSAIRCLAQSMTQCAEANDPAKYATPVVIHPINPKSVLSGQLYGNFDENTHEWSDGILAVIFRNCAFDTTVARQWMLFDGPVDAVWIENMNTVLDDNKKLCLNSGEIIKMTERMTMMFEAEDLEQASPATVSRVGMIFCEVRNLGWKPLRKVWLEAIPEDCLPHIGVLHDLFDWLLPPLSYFVQKQCTIPSPVTAQEMAYSVMRLMTCMITSPDGLASDMPKVLENCMIFSIIWSIGACVDTAGRMKFDEYLRKVLLDQVDDDEAHLDFLSKNRYYDVKRKGIMDLPDKGLVYDYRFDPKKAAWVSWVDSSHSHAIPKNAAFNSIVVPTIDTMRHEWLVTELLTNGFHVVCTGDTGTGKSVSIKNHAFVNGSDHGYMSININFSAQTTANATQDIIDSKLDKRRKGVNGPPIGTKCIVFVDDLNMPAKEEYGAQPPIEILRQWMDHSGWYNLSENVYMQLVELQFIGAMGPPVGGRTRITQRYVRHFNLINFVPFDNESLTRVFNTIMDWFLARGFSGGVKAMGQPMVTATIDVYDTISATLLPTPLKSHYTFNLRDLAKVFQGITQASKDNVKDKDEFVRIWSHECLRVFHDRLTTVDDRDYFYKMIGEKVNAHFSIDFKLKILPKKGALVYGNFIDPKIVENKPYVLMEDPDEIQKVVEDYLEDYNSMSSKPMSLVLFANAVEHICRISRIINQPYGNALLVGVGGSGRKSLSALATFIADFKSFSIALSRTYGTFEWREDLKKVFMMTGTENQPTVFVFDDTQIIKESFLEDVNGILNTGEVPNLFNGEELAAVLEGISKDAREQGVNTGSNIEMMAFFTTRVRNNLHMVLCLSPIGDAFRTRLRMFPALVNCCTIDWFTAWPEDALRSVAQFFLNSIDMASEVRQGLIDVCVNMQLKTAEMADRYTSEMGRYYYVTPTSYLELINSFKGLLNKTRDRVGEMKSRYDNGLTKIRETQVQVDEMKKYLIELQPQLEVATVETDKLLVRIKADTEVADKQKAIVQKDEDICKGQAEEANEIKASCEADLAEALPALDAAVKALNSLKASDFDELKGMKVPSAAVVMVMTALCPMMNVKPIKVKDPNGGSKKVDDFWEAAKGKEMLGNGRELLKKMLNYDKDNMDPHMVEVVSKQTANPDFNPEYVAKGSVACAGVCKWIKAMMIYDRVAKMVGPKKIALAAAEEALATAMASLAEKQASLKALMDKLAELQEGLDAANKKKGDLHDQVTDCATKLQRAEQLINGLGGERERWGIQSEILGVRYDNVTGDIMLAAGQIAYTGAFVTSYRTEMLSGWGKLLREYQITCSDPFSLRITLGEEVEIRQWVINKLPNDGFSIDNAIMMKQSNRWPLMIDPQGQANKWVKMMESENQLKVVKQNNPTFVRNIEMAIQFGSPVLLENLPEYIDPILEQVLTKQIVTTGGVATVQLGDNAVEYDPRFKLYLTTKLTNPHYPPELCVKVNLLNFMATADGLEDQMLGQCVAREEPALEAQREQLVLDDAANQKALKEIEDNILYLLKSAQGNILDDEVLIETLAQSKVTSGVIEQKVKQAQRTQDVIAKVRERYQPVAFHVSQLFFCIADLASIDPMYQYSLEWYIALFDLAIEKAKKSDDHDERIVNLNTTFSYVLYLNVCRSLFAKDKLLFSFLLTTKIMLGQQTMAPANLQYLLQGNIAMDLDRPNPAREGSWLSDKIWGEILALTKLPSFKGIDKDIEKDLKAWATVFENVDAASALKDLTEDKYTTFQRLCILRAIRPDVCIPVIQMFISEEVGEKFIDPPPFDLRACYEDSNCSTPLVFVLTPGAAPMGELFKLAESTGFGNKLHSMSLGQGQGVHAERAIDEAQGMGKWVCLQNCHLCVSWMPTLERICEELSPDRVAADFRLWLTSEPSKAFPQFVLQNGVKMTNEPPKGIKANLAISYYSITEEFLEGSSRPGEFKKLLFALCFFHAHLRERLKFGPLGFNMKYVFSLPDQNITMAQLQIYLDSLDPHEDVPYAAIAYLAGECNYGGRVTDDKDRRTLMNILADFYTPGIQDDNYKFSPSGIYYAPPEGNHSSYQEYIKSLPFTEGPEIFGLHDNANISCALAETDALLSTALSLQPKSGGGGGASWDDIIAGLAEDIPSRMPKPYDVEKALLDFPTMYEESMVSINTSTFTHGSIWRLLE